MYVYQVQACYPRRPEEDIRFTEAVVTSQVGAGNPSLVLQDEQQVLFRTEASLQPHLSYFHGKNIQNPFPNPFHV